MNFMRKEKGYISIFLCIVLLPMVTYATIIVDACRVQMSRVQLQTAGDLAMNAALSEYEHKLEEMYGLFATATSEDELKPAVEKYFKETIESSLDQSDYTKDYVKTLAAAMTDWAFSSSEEFDEEDLTNFLEMQLKEFEYHGIKESRVSNPKIMKSQIIDYMKYKGPVSIAENLLEKIGFLNDSTNQIEAIQKKVEYTKAVSELKNPFDAAWNKIGDYNKERENYVKKYIIDANNDQGVNVDSAARIKMGLYEKMALMAMFQNNYEKQRRTEMVNPYYPDSSSRVSKPLNDVDSDEATELVENLIADGNKKIWDCLNRDTPDMENTKGALDQLQKIISENIFNIEKITNPEGTYTETEYEKKYGAFNFTIADNGTISSDTSLKSKDDSMIPHNANVSSWISILKTKNKTLEESANDASDGTVEGLRDAVSGFYEYQISFLPYYKELLERKAYFSYFKKLQEEYDKIVEKHETEFEEAIKAIPQKNLSSATVNENDPYESKNDVATYILEFKKLPGNFVKLADHKENDNKNIGGDTFKNEKKILPEDCEYFECTLPSSSDDITEKLVYTLKGGEDKETVLVYYTGDNSESFIQLIKADAEPKNLEISKEEAECYINLNNYLERIKTLWQKDSNYKNYTEFVENIFGESESNKFYRNIGNDLYKKLNDNFKEFYQSAKTLRDYTGGSKPYSNITKDDDTLLGKMLWLRTDVTAVDQQGAQWGAYIESNVHDKTAKAEMMNDQASSTETIKGDEAQDLFEVVHKIWNGYEVKYNDETLKPEVESSDDGGLKALVADIESVKFLDIGLCENNKTYSDFLKKDNFQALEITNNKILSESIINKYDEIVIHDDKATDEKKATATYGTFHSEKNDDSVIQQVKHLEYLPEINGKADTKDALDSQEEEAKEVFYYVLKNSCEAKPDKEALNSDQTGEVKNENGEVETSSKSGNEMLMEVQEKAKSQDTVEDPEKKSDDSKSDGQAEEQLATGEAGTVAEAYKTIVAENKVSEDTSDYGKLADGTGSISTDGDNDKVKKDANDSADAGNKSLDVAKDMLAKLADIGKNLGQDVYLEEYFTEMFTCQTDMEANVGKDKAAKIELLNGYSVNGQDKKLNTANPWYGKEIEYILWGDGELDKNLIKTETYIYLIRFALNAIYAFQASDITGFATMVASGTVGWCPVLVPIVKVVVILGISLAESAYDLMLLKKGEGVVLLKNGSTFVCSPRGALAKASGEIAKVAVTKAGEFVENKIDTAIDNLDEKIKDGTGNAVDECNKIFQNYADSLEEQVTSSLKSNIFTPLLNSTEGILSRINDVGDNAGDLLEELIGKEGKNGKVWDSIDTRINQLEDNEFGTIIKDLYNATKGDLKSTINKELKTLFDSVNREKISTKAIEEAIWTPFEKWIKNNKEAYITKKINKFTDDMRAKMDGYYDKGAEKLKTRLHEVIDEKSQKFSKKAGETIERGVAKYVSGTAPRSKEGGVSLTLNYKEFCKIFMFMKLASDNIGSENQENRPSETACLQRAAALIQANVRFAAAGSNPDFKIIEAYTIVNVNATVEMGTLFPWTASINTDDTGNAALQADFSDPGKKTVKINYSGICGY